jgi:hypothetical protein
VAPPWYGAEVLEEQTVVRIAENQSLFREANERIESAADGMRLVGPIPLLCECPRPECTEIVQMSLDEYEVIRQHSRRFFTAPGHQDIGVESGAAVVVGEVERYVTVEKVGIAGEISDERYDQLSE